MFIVKFKKLKSMTLKIHVGQGDPDTTPESGFPWEVPKHQIWRSQIISFSSYCSNLCVTLKVRHGDPVTIPSSFVMRGTYTPNLVNLAHIRVKLLRELCAYDDIHEIDLLTFNISQGKPDTIPGRFFMRGTYTANLVSPAHLLDNLSR